MPTVPRGYQIRKSTRPFKKYDVYQNATYLLSFGDARYGHFKDVTPVKAFTHLNHLDPERRRRYYARHGSTTDTTSARYWSHRFLWPMD